MHQCSWGFSFLTPECCTQDFRVEPLLVFADLGCVIRRAGVGGINIHHRSFSHFHLQLLKPRTYRRNNSWKTNHNSKIL